MHDLRSTLLTTCLEAFLTLHDRVHAALADAGMKTEPVLTAQLRRNALDAGWSRSAAGSIQVHHNEGHYHATFNEEGADYEYGNGNRPPLAVTRQWQNHLDDHAGVLLEHHLGKNLRGLV